MSDLLDADIIRPEPVAQEVLDHQEVDTRVERLLELGAGHDDLRVGADPAVQVIRHEGRHATR